MVKMGFIGAPCWCIFAFIQVAFAAQSCVKDILKFSKTGIITSSESEIVAGDSVSVTCSSQCTWDWHIFYINNEYITGETHTSSSYTINNISNKIFNCPDCEEPSHQDCSNSQEGPVESTVNVTFSASGEYYFQCFTQLFDLPTAPEGNWPNQIIPVYSKNLKIQVNNNPDVVVDSLQLLNNSVTEMTFEGTVTSSFIASSTLLGTATNSVSCFEASQVSPVVTTITETITSIITATDGTSCSHLLPASSATASTTTTRSSHNVSTPTKSTGGSRPVVSVEEEVSVAGTSKQNDEAGNTTPYLIVIIFLVILVVIMLIAILTLLYLYKRRLKQIYDRNKINSK